ncbi:DUF6318 family protein [Geodermatophilus maliterrae]|uniref:DUF6318 family protein n=1 Tax=Geodermatophilus maliterrae TaxID=3162531 RepID=A0ABV3XFH9_9ACTN
MITDGGGRSIGRLFRTAAALAVAAAALAGCSEAEPANDTLPTATAEPAPTTEALPPLGPADFPMPAEARTQDAAGAEAFARYYIGLINRTSTVMDAAPLRDFSQGCRDCERIASDTETDAAAGYRYEGGELTIDGIASALREDESATVSFIADQASLNVRDSNNNIVDDLTFPNLPNLQSGLAASWDEGRSTWVATALALG